MNINDPLNSRQLAAMIQGIKGDKRDQFLADARKSPNMEAFMKHFLKTNYNGDPE
jgi:hypothetical protein